MVPLQACTDKSGQRDANHGSAQCVVWVCSKMNWLGFCWHKMWPNVTATETEGSWWWWWVVRSYSAEAPRMVWTHIYNFNKQNKTHNIPPERWPYLLLATQHGHKQDFTNAADTQEQRGDPHTQVRFITRKDGTTTQTQGETQHTQEMRGGVGGVDIAERVAYILTRSPSLSL